MAKILAFAGSVRKNSFNRKLVAFAAELARKQKAEVSLIELREYAMPLYDSELEDEQGPPPAATRLFELMKQHDGLLLACPEYNSSITPLLKNTIDWVSRPRKGEPTLAAFTGKVAGLLSASPGQLGGLRGLVHVRSILSNIGVLVLPNQVSIPQADKAFDDSGAVREEGLAKKIEGVVTQLVNTLDKLSVS